MASIAAILDRLSAAIIFDQLSPQTRTREEDPYAIRPIANEDVFIFTKRLDNSQVIRQSDPHAGRACAWMIGGSMTGAVALIAVMLPTLYGSFAGYKIETLRQEQVRLVNEQAALELAETKILSPQHLEELARRQNFVDPGPRSIVYLDRETDTKFAKRAVEPKEEAR